MTTIKPVVQEHIVQEDIVYGDRKADAAAAAYSKAKALVKGKAYYFCSVTKMFF